MHHLGGLASCLHMQRHLETGSCDAASDVGWPQQFLPGAHFLVPMLWTTSAHAAAEGRGDLHPNQLPPARAGQSLTTVCLEDSMLVSIAAKSVLCILIDVSRKPLR